MTKTKKSKKEKPTVSGPDDTKWFLNLICETCRLVEKLSGLNSPVDASNQPFSSDKTYLRSPSFSVLVPNTLSCKECQQLINFAENRGFAHQGSRGAAFQEAVRDNDRISLVDVEFARRLWEDLRLCDLFQGIEVDGMWPVGLNPNLRFYRYAKGQKFGKHIDESVNVRDAETKYTLLIYLSGGRSVGSTKSECLIGGETIFYGKKNRLLASVVPQVGLALFHIHGDKCHEHEGAEVKSGMKYVLRSDVLFRKL